MESESFERGFGLAAAYRSVLLTRGALRERDKLNRFGFTSRLKIGRKARARSGKNLIGPLRHYETCELCHVNPHTMFEHRYLLPICADCAATMPLTDITLDANIDDENSPLVQPMAPGPPFNVRLDTPMQRLAHAILETAMLDLFYPPVSIRYYPAALPPRERGQYYKPRLEAICWLSGAPAQITFDDCCTMLGVDTDWLRGLIARLLNTPGYLPPLTTVLTFKNEEDEL